MAIAAILIALWIWRLGFPKDPVSVIAWLWLVTIAWNIEAPWRYHLKFLRDWWLPLLALIVWFYSRALVSRLGVPVHVTMPLRVDSWFDGGTTLNARLQHALCGNPCSPRTPASWFDPLLAVVYISHFFAGLTLALVLYMRSRAEWVRWMRRYVAISFGALAIFLVYPMAPPWMAARDGYTEHIGRITVRGLRHLGLGHIDAVLRGGTNQTAAMPSLHAGMATLVALYAIERLRTPWRFLALIYPVTMSFTLIYLGEHYVIDCVAGALLALLVMLGCRMWESRHTDPADGPQSPGRLTTSSSRSQNPQGDR
jgi:membrane-associated phospholipid phosphatase